MPPQKSDKRLQKKSRIIRLLVLITVLVISTTLGLMHQYSKGWVPAGVDAFCPFGGIESAFSLIFTSSMLKRIAWSSFTLLFVTILIAVLFRRSFCGLICPLGTLQELFGMLGKKVFGRRFHINPFIDRPARYVKYAVFVVFVTLTYIMGKLVIRPYDPWATYHHLASPDLFTEFSIGFAVLILTCFGSLFTDRLFCRYACPMGAFLGFINRIGIFRVKRNNSTCIHCNACDRTCPVDIEVEKVDQVQSSECINCNLCVDACPVQDTLYVEGPKKIRIEPKKIVLVTVLLFVAVISVASFTGGFEWKVKSIAEHVEESGSFNPDDILGRDTFRAVSEASGVPKSVLMKRFIITDEEFEGPIKEAVFREDSGFDTEDVREFIRERMKK
jgi:polyferredoxin